MPSRGKPLGEIFGAKRTADGSRRTDRFVVVRASWPKCFEVLAELEHTTCTRRLRAVEGAQVARVARRGGSTGLGHPVHAPPARPQFPAGGIPRPCGRGPPFSRRP